jgi:hypothetical protein
MQLIHRPEGAAGFQRIPIPDAGLALRRTASGELALAPPHGVDGEVAQVRVFVENDVRGAALVVAPGVRDVYLGGLRPLGVCVLAERDEIVVGAQRLYFTARTPLARGRHEHDASCGVCGDPVRGCEAVVCSSCGACTHDGALADGTERRCLGHRGACPGCGLREEDLCWMPQEDERA